MRTAARLPLLVAIAALLILALVVERDRAGRPSEPSAGRAVDGVSMVGGEEVLGWTWYCAAGSSDPEGPAGKTIVLSNSTEQERGVTLTAFGGRAEPVSIHLVLPALTVERLRVEEILSAPAVAVMAEVDGGGVVASQELAGQAGRHIAPCASTSAREWHFAWADTSRDARSLFAVFNPFPGDAVVDFVAVTTEGLRHPQALTGLVVPGSSVVVADLGAEVTRRDQVSVTVRARAGRVVVERLQSFDGSEERTGLVAGLGAPAAAETWVFPGARLGEEHRERMVIYNPGDATAEVDVEVLVPDTLRGGVEPFELAVRPNSFEVLDLGGEPRLADILEAGPLEVTVVVRSLNAVGVVAERVVSAPLGASLPGISSSPGTPLVAGELILVDPRPPGAVEARLALANLDSTTIVSGRIEVISRGSRRSLEGFESFEIGPAGRLEVDLIERVSAAGASLVVVRASAPLAAEVVASFAEPPDRGSWPATFTPAAAVPPPDPMLG